MILLSFSPIFWLINSFLGFKTSSDLISVKLFCLSQVSPLKNLTTLCPDLHSESHHDTYVYCSHVQGNWKLHCFLKPKPIADTSVPEGVAKFLCRVFYLTKEVHSPPWLWPLEHDLEWSSETKNKIILHLKWAGVGAIGKSSMGEMQGDY